MKDSGFVSVSSKRRHDCGGYRTINRGRGKRFGSIHRVTRAWVSGWLCGMMGGSEGRMRRHKRDARLSIHRYRPLCLFGKEPRASARGQSTQDCETTRTPGPSLTLRALSTGVTTAPKTASCGTRSNCQVDSTKQWDARATTGRDGETGWKPVPQGEERRETGWKPVPRE